MASLEGFSTDELIKIRKDLDQLIKDKFDKELGKRQGQRAKVKIPGNLEIEREKEFFDQTHKINIREMSTNGLTLTIPATVIENDIMAVTFRLPSNGEKKVITCQAMRVKEISSKDGIIYEVAAQAVDESAVKAYRSMLKNRGK